MHCNACAIDPLRAWPDAVHAPPRRAVPMRAGRARQTRQPAWPAFGAAANRLCVCANAPRGGGKMAAPVPKSVAALLPFSL